MEDRIIIRSDGCEMNSLTIVGFDYSCRRSEAYT